MGLFVEILNEADNGSPGEKVGVSLRSDASPVWTGTEGNAISQETKWG